MQFFRSSRPLNRKSRGTKTRAKAMVSTTDFLMGRATRRRKNHRRYTGRGEYGIWKNINKYSMTFVMKNLRAHGAEPRVISGAKSPDGWRSLYPVGTHRNMSVGLEKERSARFGGQEWGREGN